MKTGLDDRENWLKVMLDIISPVLNALSERQLKAVMPVHSAEDARRQYTYLEALGRTLAGIAPWLECEGLEGEEEQRRKHFAGLARRAVDAAIDPASPDYMNFHDGMQPIVDAAFLAQAIVRAPRELLDKLEPQVKQNLVSALKATRSRKPAYNNWLLFAAMIETALFMMQEDWDSMRIDYALKQHEQWYLGDGHYSDGPEFHADYYNSFVIHPMIVDVIESVGDQYADWSGRKVPLLRRARRYAEIQERMISPEGTFPPLGRSLAYRFGAFQLLAQMALREDLPTAVSPAQVRCALTAVIQRMTRMPGTFDEQGWLHIGFCGHQPSIGESYITTGSLYLCTTVFLPLGLSPQADFWRSEPEDWTSRKIWSGTDQPRDQALKNESDSKA